MTLQEEYKKQNTWRDWERYLDKLPLHSDQIVYDLGCGIGYLSKLLSDKVQRVVGFDTNNLLLEEANKNKPDNCEFVLEDIWKLDAGKLNKCHGIWLAFTLAYMPNPAFFLSKWMKCLSQGGWVAIVDIDELFLKHLPYNSKYFKKINLFETEAETSRIYDFKIGSKIRDIMTGNGLDIVVAEEDWYDKELNFTGKASTEIVRAWENRLERMIKLKAYLGEQYADFSKEFLKLLFEEEHKSVGGIKFYVGIKR